MRPAGGDTLEHKANLGGVLDANHLKYLLEVTTSKICGPQL